MRFPPLWKSFESKNSPEFPNCTITLVESTYENPCPWSEEKRDVVVSLSFFSRFDLYYFINFPSLFFFDGWKWNDNICRWIKGGRWLKGIKKKKKEEKYNARHSVFDTIATRSAGGMSFSANLPSPPPPTLGAAGNRSARSVIDSELLHTTFVRASRCNRVMTENCVITQFIRSGGERSI